MVRSFWNKISRIDVENTISLYRKQNHAVIHFMMYKVLRKYYELLIINHAYKGQYCRSKLKYT